MSQKNEFKVVSFKAKRGTIFDRNGITLAYDAAEYKLTYTPSTPYPDKLTALLGRYNIAHLNSIDINKKQSWLLSRKQVISISSHLHNFPSLKLETHLKRKYTYGILTAHLIGLFGKNDNTNLQHYPRYERSARAQIGKSGVEKDYEQILAGTPGIKRIHTDARGNVKSEKVVFEAKPGNDLKLTIDIELQKAAADSLRGHKGALVAIQPRTGDILAIVSSPSFDPDIFYDPNKSSLLGKTINDKNQPMFNRAINGLYSPASTIKPMLALGGLNAKVVTPTEKIFDPGYFYIPGSKHRFNNWYASGQGYVDIIKAIQVSCDTYFYNLAYKMGINMMFDTLHKFGFGQSTGTFPGESIGYVPKHDSEQNTWHTGNTIITGIGQGKLLVTPLQLALATATISLNGARIQPRITLGHGALGKITDPTGQRQKANIQYDSMVWKTVITGMQKSLGPHGTGRILATLPMTLAGKTGTAQLVKIDRSKTLPQNLQDNSLLIAYSPIENPEIAIALIIENEHQSTHVGKKFLTAWLSLHDKQKAKPGLQAT